MESEVSAEVPEVSPAVVAEEAPVESTETATAETDPFESGADSFDRKYVEGLRKESAGYRERAKQYESVFSSYDDDAKGAWLDLAKTFADDPIVAAEKMRTIASEILESSETEANLGADGDVPLTRAEYETLKQEEQAQEAQKAAVREVETEAEGLGYTKDTRDYYNLLLIAQNETGGDMKKADEVFKAERQKMVDDYLAEKAQDASGSSAPVTGQIPSSEQEIKSFADAKASLKQRLLAAKEA